MDSLYSILDKKTKLAPETFNKLLREQIPDRKMADTIVAFMEVKNFSEIRRVVEDNFLIQPAKDELGMLIQYLNLMGLDGYYIFDPSVVRGLAYYTGIVFEIYSKTGELRAIGGGGSYDNLLEDFGGPPITGTGFGMGDCVLEILLREKGLLEDVPAARSLDDFIVCIDDDNI